MTVRAPEEDRKLSAGGKRALEASTAGTLYNVILTRVSSNHIFTDAISELPD